MEMFFLFNLTFSVSAAHPRWFSGNYFFCDMLREWNMMFLQLWHTFCPAACMNKTVWDPSLIGNWKTDNKLTCFVLCKLLSRCKKCFLQMLVLGKQGIQTLEDKRSGRVRFTREETCCKPNFSLGHKECQLSANCRASQLIMGRNVGGKMPDRFSGAPLSILHLSTEPVRLGNNESEQWVWN